LKQGVDPHRPSKVLDRPRLRRLRAAFLISMRVLRRLEAIRAPCNGRAQRSYSATKEKNRLIAIQAVFLCAAERT
jgi:hypothetical protein